LFDRRPSYELDQLVPIVRVLADPGVLPVLTTSPYKMLQDLIADAKKRPGQITFSSSGNYGAAHVPFEMFQQSAGIKLQHVPYRGGGPALAAFIGGQVDITAQAPGPVKPYVDEGRVRLLASWGGKRTAELADVPTFIELGFPRGRILHLGRPVRPQGHISADHCAAARCHAGRHAKSAGDIGVREAGSPPAYLDQPDFVRFIEADAARLIPAVKKIGRLE